MPTPRETEKKVLSFQHEPPGWHYGQGGPAPYWAVRAALFLLEPFGQAPDQIRTDAFLGVGGQVQIVGYQGEHFLEATIERHGGITFIEEESGEEVDSAENLALEEAIARIEGCIERWGSSDLSTQSISWRSSGVSQAWLSQKPVMTGSLSLTTNVQLEPARVDVDTSNDSIQIQLVSRSYSGEWIREPYRHTARSNKRTVIPETVATT